MAQKRRPDQRKLIKDAALSLAAQQGWAALTIEAVARKSRLKTGVVSAIFPDTWDILLHVLQVLDEEALKEKPEGGAWRDNLFDTLMNRFDLLEKNKQAFIALPADLAKNPKAALKCARPFFDSMQSLLRHTNAPASPLHVAAFGGLYLMMQETWRSDDTADLSKTMAEVDKRLGQFEKAAGYLACKN